jgi:DNA primase
MAGQIPQQFIDQLLDRIDIVELIDARVKLRKAGKDYSARCPFHEEKSPSFSVVPSKQFFYCFGCGASGNAIGFLMDYERLDFPEAVEKLAASLGLEVPREGGETRQDDGHKALLDILHRADQWFRRQLREHSDAAEAIDYLKQRGLHGAIARDFGIGFAPPGWDNLLRALATGEREQKLLLAAGLLIEKDGGGYYDRFRHRIIFPIRDIRGRTIAFGGRVLGDDKPKYLNSPETAVFHKGRELYGRYEVRQCGQDGAPLLVVEGYMDAVMLAQHGIREAVATLGTALTNAHMLGLFRHHSEVIICFDGDVAGRRAAERALQLVLPAMEGGRQVRFLFLPEGEDPDSLVQRIGATEFRGLLNRATPLSEQLFETLGQDIDLSSLDGRARLAKLALPAVARISGAMFRGLMLDELARRSGVGREELQTFAESAQRQAREKRPLPAGPSPSAPPSPPPRRRTAGLSIVERAIALLLHQPDLAAAAGPIEALASLDEPHVGLLVALQEKLSEAPETTLGSLLGYWYGSPEGSLLARLAAVAPASGGEEANAREFEDLISRLRARINVRQVDAQRRELEQIPFEELSSEQKREYLALLRQKRGNSP